MRYEVELRSKLSNKSEFNRVNNYLKENAESLGKKEMKSYLFQKPTFLRIRLIKGNENALITEKTGGIITSGITSNLKDSENSILIENKNLINGEIPIASRIKVDKLFTLEKSIVKKSMGKINVETFEKVKREFTNLI